MYVFISLRSGSVKCVSRGVKLLPPIRTISLLHAIPLFPCPISHFLLFASNFARQGADSVPVGCRSTFILFFFRRGYVRYPILLSVSLLTPCACEALAPQACDSHHIVHHSSASGTLGTCKTNCSMSRVAAVKLLFSLRQILASCMASSNRPCSAKSLARAKCQ